MTHYICTGGCGGVSDNPGVCNAKSCMKHDLPLTVCHCTDGKHEEAYSNPAVHSDEAAKKQ